MVLKEDNAQINLEDLNNSIPEDHLCYFIENVVEQVNCSEEDSAFVDINSETGYPCKLLLRLILMSIFDGGLSSREIERKTNTDAVYMYLARLKNPCFKTIAKFKSNFPNLIFEAFKTSIETAKNEDLVKIHQLISDTGITKEKSDKLNNNDLKRLKQNLNESISVDKDVGVDSHNNFH